MRVGKASVGVLIAAAALCPVGAAAAASSPRAPGRSHRAAARACTPGQLAVWIDTHGSGAAGSVYYHLRFTNISTRACTLTGYTGVSAVNAAGRTLGKPASRSPVHPPSRVTLSGVSLARGGPTGLGGSATAILRIVDVDNYPAARCGRATSVGLRVYAPNLKAAKFVSLPFLACARTSAPYLSVGSVQRGTPTG